MERTAEVFEVEIDSLAALEIARRARGTPRIANRYYDVYEISHKFVVTEQLRWKLRKWH